MVTTERDYRNKNAAEQNNSMEKQMSRAKYKEPAQKSQIEKEKKKNKNKKTSP